MPKIHLNLIIVIVATLLTGSAAVEDPYDGHAQSFPKDIDAFHSALAPLWHAAASKERSPRVCAQALKLEGLAREIRSADSKPLLRSIAALRTQCQTSPTSIDAAFAQVHQAFHRLAETSEH